MPILFAELVTRPPVENALPTPVVVDVVVVFVFVELESVGKIVGDPVGINVDGIAVGPKVGIKVGILVGFVVLGAVVGTKVGEEVGIVVDAGPVGPGVADTTVGGEVSPVGVGDNVVPTEKGAAVGEDVGRTPGTGAGVGREFNAHDVKCLSAFEYPVKSALWKKKRF